MVYDQPAPWPAYSPGWPQTPQTFSTLADRLVIFFCITEPRYRATVIGDTSRLLAFLPVRQFMSATQITRLYFVAANNPDACKPLNSPK
jgi:hypothetical protein